MDNDKYTLNREYVDKMGSMEFNESGVVCPYCSKDVPTHIIRETPENVNDRNWQKKVVAYTETDMMSHIYHHKYLCAECKGLFTLCMAPIYVMTENKGIVYGMNVKREEQNDQEGDLGCTVE